MFRAGCYSSKSLIRLCKTADLQRCCKRYGLFKRYGYRKGRSQTLYDDLEVDILASDQDIKIKYLELCKKYHPDSNVEDKSLHEKFVTINEAYKVLSSPKERRLYDKALQAGLNPEPGEVNTTEDWDPNRSQYYYHPKFYHDPKMREAAAKAWQQNTGYNFPEYYKVGDTENRREVDRKSKQIGMTISICAMLFSFLLVVRVYKKSKNRVLEERGDAMYRQYQANGQTVTEIKGPADHSRKARREHNAPTQAEKDFPFLYTTEKNG